MSGIELAIARNKTIVAGASAEEKTLLQAVSNLFFGGNRPLIHDELWSVMTLKVLQWVRDEVSPEEALREAMDWQRQYKAATQAAASETAPKSQPGISSAEKAANTAAILAALSKGATS